MNRRTSHFHRDKRVQTADGSLKRCEKWVLVRKKPELARLKAYTDAGRNVFLGWLEPGVALCLRIVSSTELSMT
jgi:hypothetical protein